MQVCGEISVAKGWLYSERALWGVGSAGGVVSRRGTLQLYGPGVRTLRRVRRMMQRFRWMSTSMSMYNTIDSQVNVSEQGHKNTAGPIETLLGRRRCHRCCSQLTRRRRRRRRGRRRRRRHRCDLFRDGRRALARSLSVSMPGRCASATVAVAVDTLPPFPRILHE